MQDTSPIPQQPHGTTVASGTITTTASADVIGLQKPQLTLVKAADRTEYTAPGEVINYTLRVTNTGNVTVTGITMTDLIAPPVCTGAPYTLAPGNSATCTATHTVTMADIMTGTVVNTAEATGFSPTSALVDTHQQHCHRTPAQPSAGDQLPGPDSDLNQRHHM